MADELHKPILNMNQRREQSEVDPICLRCEPPGMVKATSMRGRGKGESIG